MDQLRASLSQLWADVNQQSEFQHHRPILAHYTSLQALDLMLRSGEIWFSNPLYMNDFEELGFGMRLAADFYPHCQQLKDVLDTDSYSLLEGYLRQRFADFNERGAFDVYVFCACKHDVDDDDGLLSMWRGYGAGGHGVAIVLNTEKIQHIGGMPIILGPVTYMTTPQRHQWMAAFLDRFANLLRGAKLDAQSAQLAGDMFFHRVCQFALFTKHSGFREEAEWRAVYMADNDRAGAFASLIDVVHDGKGGAAPKFKLRDAVLASASNSTTLLVDIIEKVILGPGLASPLNALAAERLLRKSNPAFTAPVVRSTTPFRARK